MVPSNLFGWFFLWFQIVCSHMRGISTLLNKPGRPCLGVWRSLSVQLALLWFTSLQIRATPAYSDSQLCFSTQESSKLCMKCPSQLCGLGILSRQQAVISHSSLCFLPLLSETTDLYCLMSSTWKNFVSSILPFFFFFLVVSDGRINSFPMLYQRLEATLNYP